MDDMGLHKIDFILQCKLSQRGFTDRPWKNSLIRVKIQNLHLVRAFNTVIVCLRDVCLYKVLINFFKT